MKIIFFLGVMLGSLALAAHGEETSTSSKWLSVGIAQMAVGETIEVNRERILSGIAQTAARGVRVVIFPEGALRGRGGEARPLSRMRSRPFDKLPVNPTSM